MPNVRKPLTRESLAQALACLTRQDPLLRDLAGRYGIPPLWQRTQTFDTLVHVVMEQKVSIASARAVMQRVRLQCPGMKPSDFLSVPSAKLRAAGISERKYSYCRSIAEAILSDDLNLARLRRFADDEVMQQLVAVRGIGPWTAGVYLLMALRRPDAWASGDRALAVSLAESEGRPGAESCAGLDERAESWRPHRGTAARLLWHAYLVRRAQ